MLTHQTRARYCRAGRRQETEATSAGYTCEACGMEFTRKFNLQRHSRSCRQATPKPEPPPPVETAVQEQNKLLREIVTRLQGNPRNVFVNNLEPLTVKDIEDHLDNLTIDVIQNGGKGYADFAGGYSFKDRIACTDKSRKKLKFKDTDGEIIDDGGGMKLVRKFFTTIAKRNEEIINNEYSILQEKVERIASEGNAYTSDITDLLNKSTNLQSVLLSCQQAARGEENQLTKEFVNRLTKYC